MKPVDGSGPLTQALRAHAVLDALVEHDLHADADAEHRTTTRKPTIDDHVATHGADALHARREGTHTGDDQRRRLQRHVEVAGDRDVGPHLLEGTLRRAQVAGAVVEDGDVESSHGINWP